MMVSAPGSLRAILALMVTIACWTSGVSSAAPSLPARRELQSTITTGCNFGASNPGTLSTAWVSSLGFSIASAQGAMDCFNKIQIDADFAKQSITQLGAIFSSSYVFSAIAVNPTANVPTIPYPFDVYNYSSNILGDLNALANSYGSAATVNFGDLQFAINEVFNKLFDAHVVYSGATQSAFGTTFGNTLYNMTRVGAGSVHAYLVEPVTGMLLYALDVQQANNGTLVVSGQFLAPDQSTQWVTFASINDDSPMKYLIQLANNPALNLPYKPLGTRINALLEAVPSLIITRMGRPTSLPNASATLTTGQTLQLQWGVTVPPALNASTLNTMQAQANTPGVPIMALLKSLSVFLYDNVTVQAQPGQVDPEDIPVEKTSRRMMQGLGSNVTYLGGNASTAYGFYFFTATTPPKAVLKLTSFAFDFAGFQSWFPRFVAAARAQNATDLLIDVIDNGGGSVINGVGLVMGLFNPYYGELGIRYDRIMGPDAVYAYANGIHPDIVNATVLSLVSNSTWLQARVAQINANQTDFKRLALETKLTLSAITTLFASASASQTQVCSNIYLGTQVACNSLWQPYAKNLTALVDSILASSLTPEGFAAITYVLLPNMLQAFWPYVGLTSDDNVDPYTKPVQRLRGGQLRNYTMPFDLLGIPDTTSVQDFFNVSSTYTPPFSRILALSDGSCGSTCDTFARTSWFYSNLNPTAPVFRFLTYGGTGNLNDSSATAFPGGNVNDNDYLTASWAYYVTLQLLADWASLDALNTKSDAWAELLPVFPAFLDNLTPRYTQSEIYHYSALGPNALPQEYYSIPTDYYLPAWYHNTDIPQPGQPSDLAALYSVAAVLVDSLPRPKVA